MLEKIINFKVVNYAFNSICEKDGSHANLHRANLTGANLQGANIAEANILAADLTRANLRGTIGSFGLAHGALYHNTIMNDGHLFVGPDTIEG